MPVLRRGDSGPAVIQVRATLASLGLLSARHTAPGDGAQFDCEMEEAVRAFQQRRGLIVDGIVGTATEEFMQQARWKLGDRTLVNMISAPLSGDDVFTLQERLLELGYDAGRADAVFGAQTEHALRNFQRDYGLTVDGMCGAGTIRALRQLAPKVRGGRPVLLREQERVRRAGSRLTGKRIVIDPGHGESDSGVTAGGVRESDLMWDMARRLEGRMAATGMEALLSRGPHAAPSDAERAQFANEAGADLFLSLHTDGHGSASAQGLATFHFGNGHGTTSTVGQALAELLQRELIARTRFLDCRTHGKTWEALRLTKMPAVQLELGYLTSVHDRVRLLDVTFRDRIAEGILVAVKRLYLLGENDQPTGTFTFSDLLQAETARAETG